ncbi:MULTISPECIES: hypothetical protein [unclassified Streptomyces]|uniref:hypothetical protein n=1 Tax=unclassified Streptomyces TaxID=2593676 RepID=UPI0036FAB6F8
MPTMELTDLDNLITELDERITGAELPTMDGGLGDTGACSGLCTVLICSVIGVC